VVGGQALSALEDLLTTRHSGDAIAPFLRRKFRLCPGRQVSPFYMLHDSVCKVWPGAPYRTPCQRPLALEATTLCGEPVPTLLSCIYGPTAAATENDMRVHGKPDAFSRWLEPLPPSGVHPFRACSPSVRLLFRLPTTSNSLSTPA